MFLSPWHEWWSSLVLVFMVATVAPVPRGQSRGAAGGAPSAGDAEVCWRSASARAALQAHYVETSSDFLRKPSLRQVASLNGTRQRLPREEQEPREHSVSQIITASGKPGARGRRRR